MTQTLTPASQLVDQFVAQCRTADGIFAVGPDQRITHWSNTAADILGRAEKQALGRTCQDVIGGRDVRNARFCRTNCPIIRNAQKGRPTPNYDILVQTGDGVPKWLNVTLVLFPDPETHTMSVVHLFRDVTRRRRLEEKARHAIQELQRTSDGPETEPTADARPELVPPAAGTTTARITGRELEALRLLAVGLSTEQIAESLGVSRITARNHITNLQTKLGAKTRLQVVLYASQQRII